MNSPQYQKVDSSPQVARREKPVFSDWMIQNLVRVDIQCEPLPRSFRRAFAKVHIATEVPARNPDRPISVGRMREPPLECGKSRPVEKYLLCT
jgi:hypothetical protein